MPKVTFQLLVVMERIPFVTFPNIGQVEHKRSSTLSVTAHKAILHIWVMKEIYRILNGKQDIKLANTIKPRGELASRQQGYSGSKKNIH